MARILWNEKKLRFRISIVDLGYEWYHFCNLMIVKKISQLISHYYLMVSLSVPLIAAGNVTITIRFIASKLSTPHGHF